MKVDLIDHMGTDLTVVNAARVSFHKESEWETKYYTKSFSLKTMEDEWYQIGNPERALKSEKYLSEKDTKLIKYLATHGHWTPFSHVMLTMRETVPIFVARQRFKHMVGFTYNEVSRRYVDERPTFFIPEQWRKRAENKKQGSSDEIVEGRDLGVVESEVETLYEKIRETYEYLLEIGVAPEQARMVLPQSMYTSYYVTGSLAAWARAYKLRSDPHAQREIRDLAEIWNERIRDIYELKHSWEALVA